MQSNVSESISYGDLDDIEISLNEYSLDVSL